MKPSSSDVFAQNKVIVWIAIGTGLLLLVPLWAMQFTDDVNWNVFDFAVAGALMLGTGVIFVLAARKARKYWALIGMALAAAFLLLWAELAVGVFTNWGS